ncbi:hypothetical protein NEOLI_004996 [Neolecta irregularis DAH-3]|uniref:Uncharacterized protein n=1 Tax=Neolecta irregularis (strain DAH-3) TaxID=1198029 RepID=A0A1U7LM78_NEOID|nr:hypothetical protein NEOLI_004996 [Neolecta irregularis DAH-3]|eukprot:OLL23765.1 hypothetical protein NEOLI_004996 [Neolecta irregularis DAH-3]
MPTNYTDPRERNPEIELRKSQKEEDGPFQIKKKADMGRHTFDLTNHKRELRWAKSNGLKTIARTKPTKNRGHKKKLNKNERNAAYTNLKILSICQMIPGIELEDKNIIDLIFGPNTAVNAKKKKEK